MRAVWPLIARTVRHQRVQILSVILLVALAAAPLNLGVILTTSYLSNYDRRAAELDTPDALLTVFDAQRAKALESELRTDADVSDVQVEQTLGVNYATYDFNDADMWTQLTFLPEGDQSALGRYEVVSQTSDSLDTPVYLPLQFQSSGGYDIGDAFTVKTTTGERTFHVKGFIEWILLSNVNMGQVGMVVPQDVYDSMEQELPSVAPQTAISLNTSSDPDAALTRALHNTSDVGNAASNAVWNITMPLATSVTGMGANMFAVALIGFAAIMTLVVVIVLAFIVRNAVQRDLPAIGTLKATGFSSAQIVTAIALAFGLAALVASVAGSLLSYGALPIVQQTLEQQTGLRWSPGFSATALLVCAGVLTGTVIASGLLIALRVRKIPPLVALRGGVTTHSFRRNWFPLARTRGSLNLTMGVKESVQRSAQTAMVAVVVAMVAFAGLFAVSLRTNLLGNPDRFTQIVTGDHQDIALHVSADSDTASVQETVADSAGVRKVFRATYGDSTAIEGREVPIHVVDDFDHLDYSSVYEGRSPRHANEISIGSQAAKSFGKQVGDTITVSGSSGSEEFLIVGLVQSVSGLGFLSELTIEGYQRIDKSFEPKDLAIYVDDTADITKVMDTLQDELGGQASSVVNYDEFIKAATRIYLSMLDAMSWGIIALTALVIVVVVAFASTTTLVDSAHSLGVRKALGFSSANLLAQLTALAGLPLLLGVAGGWLLSLVGVAPLLTSILSMAGLAHINMTNDPVSTWQVLAVIVAIGLVVTFLGALRVRRITPYNLMTE